jgi:hypothetical protein
MSMNEKRAMWAHDAVERFREVCPGSKNKDGSIEMSEAIGDLLVNLFHLCDLEDIDAAGAAKRALAMYRDEVENPDF